jgi:protein gp37
LGETTKISWAGRTWNPWIGCRDVNECCDNCYARAMINRTRGKGAFDTVVRSKTWNDPIRWQKEAEREGRCDLVFTCSLSDFFIQDADEWRPAIWSIIRRTPNMIYQVLTKRPNLITARLPADWAGGSNYKNVWLGTSIGMKKHLRALDALREVPAYVRFISAEPLLENLMPEFEPALVGYHWCIIGGESGNNTKNFRPMDHTWVREMFAACTRRKVARFFKQSANVRTEMGVELDGRLVREYPKQYDQYRDAVRSATSMFGRRV